MTIFQREIEETPSSPVRKLKSVGQQRREKLQLYTHCLLTSTEYHLYGFDQQGKDYAYMLNFMTLNAFWHKFRNTVNDSSWKPILDNKWLFYLHYGQFNLPMPEVYGIYDHQFGFTQDGKLLTEAHELYAFLLAKKPGNIVVKPVGGIMGKQILIIDQLHYNGEIIQAVTNTGENLSFSDLTAIIDRPSKVKYYVSGGYKLNLSGYLLQKKVDQHEFLNNIAPYTTNTIRIVTFLDHKNDVDIHFAVLRLGRKGDATDNWTQGGISVGVDLASGLLGEGVLNPKYRQQQWLTKHPDSGTPFTGRHLPYWNEIIDVCSRAAKVTPGIRSIGWDVAITPSGPVILEGNPDWGLRIVQVHSQGFLQPRVREQLAHFGLIFPEETLPPINLRDWWIRFREHARYRSFTSGGLLRAVARDVKRKLK